MQAFKEIENAAPETVEDWVLEALDADPLPVEHLVTLITRCRSGGQAREWAQLLAEAMANRALVEPLTDLLLSHPQLLAGGSDFREACLSLLKQACKERMPQCFLKSCGLTDRVETNEALRRLQTLNALREGALCTDGTWGFGIVRDMDDFYEKVTIDFDRKKGHQLSFAYAGETLELIPDTHLLALRHRDRAALDAMVKDDAAAVVRVALASYGDVNVARLKELLVDAVLPESDWKRFWDAARKGLKNDPLVEIPTKRSEPIVMRSEAKAYDAGWFERLKTERDVKQILMLVNEYREAGEADLTPAQEHILRDRLEFAAVATEDNDPATAAKALMVMTAMSLVEPGGRIGSETFLGNEQRLMGALEGLASRDIQSFFALLIEADSERLCGLLTNMVPACATAVLPPVLACLEAQGQIEGAAATLRAAFQARTASVVYVAWASKQSKKAFAWDVTTPDELLASSIAAVCTRLTHDGLRAQKVILSCLEDRAWLGRLMKTLSAAQRTKIFQDVRLSREMDAGESRALMARMVRLYPELQEALAHEPEPDEAATTGRFTSWRSLRQRQQQLQRLVEVEIPENSKEIGVARSYGDLRENFEYQAAKDKQRLLMQRQAEMETDLKQVRGTDFASVSTDKVGMGTCVTVSRPDGKRHTYNILGEWDRDESLDIISSGSLLAKRMAGRTVGDSVDLPGLDSAEGDADERCRIEAIRGVDDAVCAWIQASAAAVS